MIRYLLIAILLVLSGLRGNGIKFNIVGAILKLLDPVWRGGGWPGNPKTVVPT